MYEFPYKGDKYSAIVSGGADSGLLLYYLLLDGKPVNVYTTASAKTSYKNAHTSMMVVQKCMELTNNYQVSHQIFYQPQGDIKTILTPLLKRFDNEIELLYTGVTANPPAGAIHSLSGQESERDPNTKRNINLGLIMQPFTNFDKKWIAERYEELNLINTLFPVTRSCEHQSGEPNDPGFGHCGKCWWCKERMWAFGRL